jgi:hypothetical protein
MKDCDSRGSLIGEKGLSSRDEIQRRKVQRCSKRRKPISQKSKDKFMGSTSRQIL